MTQVVPQFQINQIFEQTPDATTNALRALLVGPDYVVRKYSTNKAAVSLGTYDDADLTVAWPGRLAGEVVDQTFTEVKIDSAALLYHTDNTDTESVTLKPNQIHSDTKSWADNGDAYPRSVTVPCDVQVGDWIRLTIGSDVQVSRVVALIGDIVPADIDTATADVDNISADAGSDAANEGGGNTGTATAATTGCTNPADFQGENTGAHGLMDETYTLTVTTVGSEGDANNGDWSTVRMSVSSASGLDDVASVTPTPGVKFAVGTLGAEIFMDHGVSGDDFALGDTFTLDVTQTYVAPTVVEAGTYTGTADTTYIVVVTKGGALDGTAEVTVTTADGSDNSGPHAVTTAVPVVIGNYGVTITFTSADVLVVGDQFTIAVTAEAEGALNTLQLANTLITALQGNTLKVELAILKDITVPKNRAGHAPSVNWSGAASAITLKAGILSSDDRTGSAELEVQTGHAYATYRALRTAGALEVHDIVDSTDITANLSGVDDVDSVLTYGAYRAISNSAGTTVKVISVPTDDLAGYQAALAKLREREDIYRLVPLTHDTAIVDACISTSLNRSGQTVGRWATVMMSLATPETIQLGSSAMATITDDPDTAGTQYTLVTDASGQFITLGVRPGDIIRAKYTADGFGGSTYSEYEVDSVISDENLLLLSGPGTAVNVASKYEIWRNLTETEQVDAWGAATQARSNRRVTSVFPSTAGRNGEMVPAYFLACSLTALRCAAAPHQGLTNAEVADWDDLTVASVTFGDLLDTVANYGGYIVTESPAGLVYIRKQLTTDLSDTKHAEDSATVNLDSISYYFKDLLAPKVGRSNVVASNLEGIRADLQAGINFLKSSGFTTSLGAQINDGDPADATKQNKVVFVRAHATLLDTVVCRIQLNLPIPLNNGLLDIIV